MNNPLRIAALSAIAATTILAGCTKEIDNGGFKNGSTLSLGAVTTEKMLTKSVINGTSFPAEEAEKGIGLFLTATDGTAYDGKPSGYSNIKYSDDSNGWASDSPIMLSATKGTLYGYFPYNSSVTDLTAVPVESSLNGTDYMYAVPVTNVSKASASVNLTMKHALARVSVKFVKDASYTGAGSLTAFSLESKGLSSSGKMNIKTGVVTPDGANSVSYAVTETITTSGIIKECLLAPTTDPDRKLIFNCTIDGREYSLDFDGADTLCIRSNINSNAIVTLKNKGLSISGIGIGEWGTGNNPEIELNEGYKVSLNTADSVFTRIETNAQKSVLTIKAGVLSRPCFLKHTVSPSNKCTYTAITDSITRELTLTISNVTDDITLTLTYPDKHNMTVAVNDEAMGKAYINTERTISGSFYEGESISFYAEPSDDSHIFCKWSDGSTKNPHIVTVGASDATLTAEFSIDISNSKKVAVKVENGADIVIDGIKTISKSGTDKTIITAHSEISGRILELDIDKSSGYGTVSTVKEGDIHIFTISDITENLTVLVKYVRCNLTLSSSVDSMGAFKINGSSASSLENIIGGTTVAIEALASLNHRFVKWTDNSSTTTVRTITVKSDTTITAEFVRQWMVSAQPASGFEGMGTIKIDGTESTGKIVDNGTYVSVQAVAKSGLGFVKWIDGSGADLGNANPYIITGVTSDITIKAVFNKTYTISTSSRPTYAGNVTEVKTGFKDSTVVLTANLLDNKYRFFRWVDNKGKVIGTTNPLKITMVSDTVVIALFCYADAIPGLFSVASGKKVVFSKGNLWCDTNSNPQNSNFYFETNQYDSQPTMNGTRDEGHISHFMWHDSASNSVRLYRSGLPSSDMFFTDNTVFAINGVSVWRTHKSEEWRYLFSDRGYDNDARRGKYQMGVTVCGKTNCIVLVPDDWNLSTNPLNKTFYDETTSPKWSEMESAGAVCLPAAGYRSGDYGSDNRVKGVGSSCYYWSSAPGFRNGETSLIYSTSAAYSIRLIADYEE